jgi:hypothetical protein
LFNQNPVCFYLRHSASPDLPRVVSGLPFRPACRKGNNRTG